MKIKSYALFLILLLLLISPCSAQSYKVATFHSHSFYDYQKGINPLVRVISACQGERQNNYERCMKENVESVIEDIVKSLAAFAKNKNLILIDADSNYEKFCIIEGDMPDITEEFICEYNQAHS